MKKGSLQGERGKSSRGSVSFLIRGNSPYLKNGVRRLALIEEYGKIVRLSSRLDNNLKRRLLQKFRTAKTKNRRGR